MRDYRAKFPSLFSALERRSRDDKSTMSVAEALPAAEVQEEGGWGPMAAGLVAKPAAAKPSRLAELQSWLDASGVRAARLVPADMLRLTTEAVSLAEGTMVAPPSGAEKRPAVEVTVARRGVLPPVGPRVQLGGLPSTHAPGERVLHIRGAGPTPFGARGLVVATQGGSCEVLFEKEGFCTAGRFAQLKTMRAALLPSAALLNLSRKPLARSKLLAQSAQQALGAGLGAAALGKRYEGAPNNMWLLLDAEFLEDAAAVAKQSVEATAAAADVLIAAARG